MSMTITSPRLKLFRFNNYANKFWWNIMEVKACSRQVLLCNRKS